MSTSPDGLVTTGELGRRMDDMKGELVRVRDKLEHLATGSDLQSLGVAWQHSLDETERRIQAHQDAQDAAIAELKSWQTWAMRLTLGLVAAAIIGGVVAQGGAL